MAFDWKKWLPLIFGGGTAAAGVLGTRAQTGALNKAQETQKESTERALKLLAGMWALQYGNMAPYRAAGTAALPQLLKMSKVDPGIVMPPSAGAQAPAGAPSGDASLAAVLRSAGIDIPGLGGSGGLQTALSTAPQFTDIPFKGDASLGGRLMGGVGTGASLAGLAGKVGLGTKIGAFGGPLGLAIGAGAGAGIGALSKLFDNNNADKDFASAGINRVSDWTWNTLMPAIKRGEISPDEGQQAFERVFGTWETSMRNQPGFDKGVAEKSVQSQRGYFAPFFEQINALKGRRA